MISRPAGPDPAAAIAARTAASSDSRPMTDGMPNSFAQGGGTSEMPRVKCPRVRPRAQKRFRRVFPSFRSPEASLASLSTAERRERCTGSHVPRGHGEPCSCVSPSSWPACSTGGACIRRDDPDAEAGRDVVWFLHGRLRGNVHDSLDTDYVEAESRPDCTERSRSRTRAGRTRSRAASTAPGSSRELSASAPSTRARSPPRACRCRATGRVARHTVPGGRTRS